MKSVLLIGLGRFGRHTAQKLHELGHEVMAVDKKEENINAVLPYVTNAVIGNSTSPEFLESLGVESYDLCIVAIGDDFQSSLETTALLKDAGAKYVVARAAQGIQEKLLHNNGADAVVYPERQLAEWTAICYSSDYILDYIAVNDEFAIYEIEVPDKWKGRSLSELDIYINSSGLCLSFDELANSVTLLSNFLIGLTTFTCIQRIIKKMNIIPGIIVKSIEINIFL